MNNGIRIYLKDEIDVPDADIVIKIDYLESSESAARVFDMASELIKSFEDLDKVLITSIDSQISTKLILDNIEKSSVKIFLKNLLEEADDQALKELDWKPQVGKYLVKAKYAAIEWLDKNSEDGAPKKVEDLTDKFRSLAQETDVRNIPDYPKLNPARVAQPLDRIQKVKKRFRDGESLTITLDKKEYSVDLHSLWQPSDYIKKDDVVQELSTVVDMVLIMRKPDLLGDTQWQFRHGKKPFNAPIEDEKWLEEFHAGKHPITPGQALRVKVKYDYKYDKNGDLTESKETIIKVLGMLQTDLPPEELFDGHS